MHILLNINQLTSINVAPSGMFSPQSYFAVSDSRTDVFGKVWLFHPDTFCALFSSNHVFSGICFEHFSGVPRPLSMLSFGTLFSTLLFFGYVNNFRPSWHLSVLVSRHVTYCMPICYMLVWNDTLLPRPHFDATSWLSFNRLTFWLLIRNAELRLPRGSKTKGFLPTT